MSFEFNRECGSRTVDVKCCTLLLFSKDLQSLLLSMIVVNDLKSLQLCQIVAMRRLFTYCESASTGAFS